MNILISGAGIACLTLAYWLKQYGFTPTIIERAPHLPTGGDAAYCASPMSGQGCSLALVGAYILA